MRNLKKILALVLALVMSLSLMATASAASFPDVADDNAYKTAIDVLNGVKVFQGYNDGAEFRPTGEITRAEVAAIIYRISTGDVTDSQKDIYTAWNGAGKLSDVTTGWYAGYVNFCSNAGYIKGYPDGTFKASNKVTGYEVLAMILRAVGYGRNGEFSGSNWAITVGSLAQTLGITKNVKEDLGSPATRQMVAELLFRSIFTETQKYNALYMYEGTGTNLAKENLGLERITGVVMANEWANINENADEVLANGNTEMLVDGKTMTLKTSSELDAVGLTYNAYVQNETDVIGELEMSDVNKVAFNEGAEIDVTKLAKKESLSTGSALFFLDYDEDYYNLDKSDYLVRYAIDKDTVDNTASYQDWEDYMADIAAEEIKGHSVTERTIKADINGDGTDESVKCYVVSIRPEADITEIDVEIMKEIFYTADRIGNDNSSADDKTRGYVYGEVYIGTSSMVDQSDELSWKQFVEKYFNEGTRVSYEGANNGESLRVVDNNGDGKAEYVFKVQYWQDRAVDTYKDTLEFNSLRLGRYTDDNRVVFDDIVVGDVVNYSVIDGKLRLWKADVITDTVQTKNFKNVTVTPTNGEEKGQSEIFNETELDDNIMMMDERVEYNMYLDEFGYIRTYELAQGSKYALLTEMYTTGNQNFNYVKDNKWIAEVTAGDAKTEEYVVANRNGSVFASDAAWTSRDGRYSSELNYLQPAIAHLGNVYSNTRLQARYYAGDTSGISSLYTDWGRGIFAMKTLDSSRVGGPNPDFGVFNYGNVDYIDADHNPRVATGSFSFTNVASYALDGDNVVLNTAAKLATDRDGNQYFYKWVAGKAVKDTAEGWIETDGLASETAFENKIGYDYYPVYAVDYVQLEKEAVKGGMRHFEIDDDYTSIYYANSNGYVNATVDTEFYIVQSGTITYYNSYKDLPTIKADDVRAAYAVASNTNADADDVDYWVADVIVIETSGLVSDYESISLMYYNPRETVGYTRYVDSLNNEWRAYQPDSDDEAKITVNGDTGSWGNTSDSWSRNGYGFYKLYDTEYADGDLDAGDVVYINSDWNNYGIFAGTIQRIEELRGSHYFDVDTHGRSYMPGGINDKYVVPVDFAEGDYDVPIYRVDSKNAENIRLGMSISASDVELGDEIIWVMNKAQNKVAFMIDLGARPSIKYTAPSWLTGVYGDIITEQVGAQETFTTVTFPLALTGTETLEFTCGGKTTKYVAADTQINLTLSDKQAIVPVTLTFGGGATPGALAPMAGKWIIMPGSVSTTGNVVEFKLLNTDSGAAAMALRAAEEDHVAAYIGSKAGVDALVAMAANAIGADGGPADLEEAKAIAAFLTAVKDDNEVTYTNANLESNLGTLETAIGGAEEENALEAAKTAAKEALDKAAEDAKKELDPEADADKIAAVDAALTAAKAAVEDAEDEAGVTTAKTNGLTAIEAAAAGTQEPTKETVTVTVTGIEGAKADPATFEKDAALKSETITIQDAEGETLSTATLTSVKVGETTLAVDTDYTYESGVITFKAESTAAASGNIAILVTAGDDDTEEPVVLSFVPANLTEVQDQQAPAFGQATKYEVNESDKTITVTVEGLQKTTNTNDAESYWVGIGVTAQENATYAWNFGTIGESVEYKTQTRTQEVGGKTYATFYWSQDTGDAWGSNKTGYLSVKVGDGEAVTYTVTFNVTVAAETNSGGSEAAE